MKKAFEFCGISWDRTSDTRIFSPLLYRLSYDTAPFKVCKCSVFFISGNIFFNFSWVDVIFLCWSIEFQGITGLNFF